MLTKILLTLFLATGAAVAVTQIDTAGIKDAAITSAKMANMAQATFKGRAAAAGTGTPVDLTAAQAKTALAVACSDLTNASASCSTDATDMGNASAGTLAIARGGTGAGTNTAAFDALAACSTQGSVLYYNGTHWVCLNPGASGTFLQSQGAGANLTYAAASGATAMSVLTKTSGYTVLTADFNGAKQLLLEMNCSASCTATLPAASNSGYMVKIINVGSATATVATAGSDTFGSTSDVTWILIPGGSPQSSNSFVSNGGARWDGF